MPRLRRARPIDIEAERQGCWEGGHGTAEIHALVVALLLLRRLMVVVVYSIGRLSLKTQGCRES